MSNNHLAVHTIQIFLDSWFKTNLTIKGSYDIAKVFKEDHPTYVEFMDDFFTRDVYKKNNTAYIFYKVGFNWNKNYEGNNLIETTCGWFRSNDWFYNYHVRTSIKYRLRQELDTTTGFGTELKEEVDYIMRLIDMELDPTVDESKGLTQYELIDGF